MSPRGVLGGWAFSYGEITHVGLAKGISGDVGRTPRVREERARGHDRMREREGMIGYVRERGYDMVCAREGMPGCAIQSHRHKNKEKCLQFSA